MLMDRLVREEMSICRPQALHLMYLQEEAGDEIGIVGE